MKLYKLLKLIGDESRLKILYIIYFSENNETINCCNVNEICQLTNLSQPNVSKHLRKLYEFGIVSKKSEKNEVFYLINAEYVKECYLFLPLMEAFSISEDGQELKEKILGE